MTCLRRAALAAAAALAALLVIACNAVATAQDDGPPGVVLFGVAGLAWSDVSAEATPTLYELLGSDAAASMTVRTVRSRTCTVDGWLTLGAGRRATDVVDADGDD